MNYVKSLLISYGITAILLCLLAFLLYRFQLSGKVVGIGIIITYLVSTFSGGLYIGKKEKNKKFLWGFVTGLVYFAVLSVLSLIINKSLGGEGARFVTTMILCCGGGMLGGMIS